jgi:hypothetical protein
MTTATLQDVSGYTERDSLFWYFAATIRAAGRSVVTWFIVPFGLLGAIILAQIFPWRILKLVKSVNCALPKVKDADDLEFLRDMLKLAYGSACFYRHFCVFRGAIQEAVIELDESIDSIDLVLENKQELQGFLTAAEARKSPELPLFANAG